MQVFSTPDTYVGKHEQPEKWTKHYEVCPLHYFLHGPLPSCVPRSSLGVRRNHI